ncbi:MAG: hypothetical protein KGV50_06635 [Gammaproteobacteria bacterium]|nr:hypothetical protein [Gammaproteobacteria bacterium]
MKINRIHVFLLSFLLFSAKGWAVDKTTSSAPSWSSDSQAVYDLLVAQMKNSGADYLGSVDTLVKFANEQKDERLYAKAFRALLQTKRFNEAIAVAESWADISKRDIDKFYILALALDLQTDKATSEILKKVSKSTNEDLEKVMYPYVQALNSSWYQRGVGKVFAKLHEAYPQSSVVNEGYVRILYAEGDVDKAIEIIDGFLFDNPKDLSLMIEKSRLYRYSLRLADAEQVWINALKDFPNDERIRLAYAQFLYDKYDYHGVIKQLDLIPSDKADYASMELAAMVQIRLGDYKKAQSAYEWKNLAETEKDLGRYNLVMGFIESRQYQLAQKVCDDILNNSNAYLPAMMQIGVAKFVEDVADGDAWFDELGKDHKLEKDVLVQAKAQALETAGMTQLGLDRLNAFLLKNPKNENVRYTRGLMAAEMGLTKDAILDLKLLHASSPQNADVQNALGYTLLEIPGELEYASSLIEKSLFVSPVSPAVTDSMGWSLYKQQKYQESLPYFRHAYAMFQDGEVVGHYIMALVASGKEQLAKKLYDIEMKNLKSQKKIFKITKSIKKS